jgi:hypothetical protein
VEGSHAFLTHLCNFPQKYLGQNAQEATKKSIEILVLERICLCSSSKHFGQKTLIKSLLTSTLDKVIYYVGAFLQGLVKSPKYEARAQPKPETIRPNPPLPRPHTNLTEYQCPRNWLLIDSFKTRVNRLDEFTTIG